MSVWYIYAFAAIGLVILIVYKIYQHKKLAKSGIYEIDKLSGEQFEERLQILFTKLDYKAKRTVNGSTKPDFCADLIIEKDGVKTAVQAKRWNEPVGEQVINDIYSAIPMYDCNYGMVVTNSYFTKMAKEKAQKLKILLWNRNDLIKNILKSQEKTGTTTGAPLSLGIPTCPACNSAMVKRSGKYGPFWGCSRFPACEGTKNIIYI
jgi:restriction system protein